VYLSVVGVGRDCSATIVLLVTAQVPVAFVVCFSGLLIIVDGTNEVRYLLVLLLVQVQVQVRGSSVNKRAKVTRLQEDPNMLSWIMKLVVAEVGLPATGGLLADRNSIKVVG